MSQITLKLKLKPFSVPNFVLVEAQVPLSRDQSEFPGGIPLAKLDKGTLEELCAEFRIAVFKKAGQTP